jgi:phage protein D
MRRAIYSISVDGQDFTSNFEPYLIRLQIRLTDGGESDTCEISLDDSAGQLKMPRDDADIEVRLQWSDGGGAVTFRGKTDEPESQGSRGAGMVMNITARATDMKDKPKEKKTRHKDDAPFEDAAKEFGKLAGLNVKVSGDLAQKKRDYWAMQNESFMSWGTRIASELGATFKIRGKEAIFVARNADNSVSGQQLPTVEAIYGVNIIDWQIRPTQNRPRYNRSVVRWYDAKVAKWKQETVQISDETARVPLIETRKFSDQDRAKDRADSNAKEVERGKGGGQVTIDGEPAAQARTLCVLRGLRQGLDGAYRITEAEHRLSRDGGWTTSCELARPPLNAPQSSQDIP